MEQTTPTTTTTAPMVSFFTIDNSFNELDEEVEYLLGVRDHSSSTKPPLPNPLGKLASQLFPAPLTGLFACPPEGVHQTYLICKDFVQDKFPHLHQLEQELKIACAAHTSDLSKFFVPFTTRIRYPSGVSKQDPIKPGEILQKGYRFFSLITKNGNYYLVLFCLGGVRFLVLKYFVNDHQAYSTFLDRVDTEFYYA